MPIGFRDFFPAVLSSGFFTVDREELQATVARANKWIAQYDVNVINVETVVLPNIDSRADASEADHHTSGEMGSNWYQVVRVWFDYAES